MQRNTNKRRTMASLEVSQLASAVDGDSATDVSFTRVRTVRGRRAALQQIVEMPMDVIYEICFHLQPKDLLNLARSSKNLRSIFMSRSMRHVWRATGRNVPGLPPCPRDLNEPSYASLLFDTSCSNCMRKNCGRVYWRCRVRLCNYCLRAQSIEKLEAWNMLSLDARALVGYAGFIDSYICPLEIRARHNRETLYKPHVEAFIALMAETPIEKPEDVLKSAQENVTYLKESGASMEAWFDTWKENASIERVELRMGRLNAIRDKLDDLGWKAELDYLDLTFSRRKRFEKLPQIYKPKELTDQGWNVIRRAIINFMEDTKRDRLAYEAGILKDRLQSMPATVKDIVSNIPGLTLHTREVATCIPEVVKALDPSVVRFSDWFLQHNLRIWIPPYLEKRYRDARRSLANLLREYCSLHPSTDPFSLAVGSIFICTRCNTARTLFYAVRHHCGTGQDDTLTRPDSCPEEYYLTVRSTFSSETSWHENLYKPGLERLVAVIKACGLDPKTATVEALDQEDVLLRQVREVSLTQTSMGIMNWRTAAFGTELYRSEESKFETATGQQIAAARPLLFLSWWQSLWSSWNATEFCCAYCAEPTSTCEAVISHLRDCHDILVPTEHDGVDLRITLPAAEPVYIIWKHDQAVSESFEDPGLVTYGQY